MGNVISSYYSSSCPAWVKVHDRFLSNLHQIFINMFESWEINYMNHFKRAHYRQLTTHIFYLEKFSLAARAVNGTSRKFTVFRLFLKESVYHCFFRMFASRWAQKISKLMLNILLRRIRPYLVWPYSEHCKISRNPGYSSNGGVWCRAWLEHWDWGIIQLWLLVVLANIIW